MPEIREGEKRSDFLRRCIPQLINEGKSQEQSTAICINISSRKEKENAKHRKPKPNRGNRRRTY